MPCVREGEEPGDLLLAWTCYKERDMETALDLPGLHEVKDLFNKSDMGAQCDALLAQLDEVLHATETKAPTPRSRWLQERAQDSVVDPGSAEALLERAMYKRWATSSTTPCPFWHQLVSYQVPLRGKRSDAKWGCIDLLGISSMGYPVVVEVKCASAGDTPAKMVTQAAAYAVAIRTNWARGFADEWELVAQTHGFKLPRCDLRELPLVCAAPSEFWDRWRGSSASAKAVKSADWQALERLTNAFSERGLPVSFVEIHVQSGEPGSEPQFAEPSLSRVELFAHP